VTQGVPECDSEVQAVACRSLGISIVCLSSSPSDSIFVSNQSLPLMRSLSLPTPNFKRDGCEGEHVGEANAFYALQGCSVGQPVLNHTTEKGGSVRPIHTYPAGDKISGTNKTLGITTMIIINNNVNLSHI